MFIQWTKGYDWEYTADVSAKWATCNNHEIALTFWFGPSSDIKNKGKSQEIVLSKDRPGPERLLLEQDGVVLGGDITWTNPAEAYTKPEVTFNGNIVEEAVANVWFNGCLNLDIQDYPS